MLSTWKTIVYPIFNNTGAIDDINTKYINNKYMNKRTFNIFVYNYQSIYANIHKNKNENLLFLHPDSKQLNGLS